MSWEDVWWAHFVIRPNGADFYVYRKGHSHNLPVSPNFSSKNQARTWIKKQWKELMVEEILLK